MNITLVIMDLKFNKTYQAAVSHYLNRLRPYCKITVKHCQKPDQLTKRIQSNCQVFAVLAGQSTISSPDLAHTISNLAVSGCSDLVFTINLTTEILDAYAIPYQVLPISCLTIGSDLLTMILVEQLYRSFRIINNHPYHK